VTLETTLAYFVSGKGSYDDPLDGNGTLVDEVQRIIPLLEELDSVSMQSVMGYLESFGYAH